MCAGVVRTLGVQEWNAHFENVVVAPEFLARVLPSRSRGGSCRPDEGKIRGGIVGDSCTNTRGVRRVREQLQHGFNCVFQQVAALDGRFRLTPVLLQYVEVAPDQKCATRG